jgi:chromosome segregation ATPase
MAGEPLTFETLARFHREVMLPDVQRIVEGTERRLRDEMHALFDAQAQKLDRLETEYHMLVAGMKRLEERMDRLEQRMERLEQRVERLALKSDVQELRARVEELERRLGELDADL